MNIKLESVTKLYNKTFIALKDVQLTINQGDFICIKGSSGSGKSTLLNILGLIDTISTGEYYIDNYPTSKLTGNALAQMRNDHFGFVFQQYNLIPHLTAGDNILLPFLFSKKYINGAVEKKFIQLCEEFNIINIIQRRADLLSGGEKQRVALVRAIIKNANIIIADEPTGNLDEDNKNIVVHFLKKLNDEGKTIIMVTHDPLIWESMDCRYYLDKGKLHHYA